MKEKNIRKINKKEKGLKQKILEINLSKATTITSIIVIIAIAIITAGIITTINESNKEKVEVEEGEEYSPVNWIESTEIGEDGNYKKVPVPKGYVASQIEGETTVNGGFVIYEDNYNGKSINWDEIIIKDDSSSTENSSSASVVNEDDGKKEEGTNLKMPEIPDTPPSEDESVDDATTIPIDLPEEEQTEQEEITGNDENIENGKNQVVDEEGTKLEENVISDEPVQNESEVIPQADEATGDEGDTMDPTEQETPTAEKQTKKNIFNLQKSVNQYVWVPVPDINRICGVDANGKLWGKLYSFNTKGTTALSWTETEGKMSILSKTNYREPDVTHFNSYFDYDTDRILKSLYGETQYEMLAKEMEQNFYETMKSIEKYGGYYIGRYETGNLYNEKSAGVVRKMNESISGVTWYQMYKTCKELAGNNENIKTSMIWGSLWDETLKWLVESGAKTSAGITITCNLIDGSAGWGNYNTTTFNYISAKAEQPESTEKKDSSNAGTKIPTGSAEYTKANNIYDMAGNVSDSTIETKSVGERVMRGNSYYYYGSTSVGVRVEIRSTSTGSNLGCRAFLYIR